MSTAAVTSSSIQQQFFNQRDSELKQLGQALQSGNLTAATQAFSAIQNLGQTVTGGNEFRVSQRQQDFNAVGVALQNGDLAGAQQAFEQLRSTVGPQRGAVDPPNGTSATVVNLSLASLAQGVDPVLGSSSTISGTTGATSTGSTGTTASGGNEIVLNLGNLTPGEEVTIGVSSGSNGGEQLTIGVSGQSGQSPEQFTLNIGSGQQVLLNLLNGAAATTTGGSTSAGSTSTGSTSTGSTSATGGVSVTA